MTTGSLRLRLLLAAVLSISLALTLTGLALVLLALPLPPLWADRAPLRHPWRKALVPDASADPSAAR